MLATTRAGVAADSVEEAASVLDQWLRCWSAGGALAYDADRSEIARYSQPRQVATLARLLDRAVSQHHR